MKGCKSVNSCDSREDISHNAFDHFFLAPAMVNVYNLALMKLNSKTGSYLTRFIFLGVVIGTLSWAIIERLLSFAGIPLDLSIGPLGADLYVISLYFRANPGTILGALLGYRLFIRA